MIVLRPHALTATLMAEMSAALERIEAGDYDGAHALLKGRCRWSELLQTMPQDLEQLHYRRAYRHMQELIPAGLLRPWHLPALESAAMVVATALHRPEWAAKPENLLTAASMAAVFGLSLEWDFDAAEEG